MKFQGTSSRTAIARAIVHKPQLLLADEPTGNLDSKSSNDVMEMLDTLNKEEKATMMLVTHDPYAASFCSRVIFIKMVNCITKFIVVKVGKPFIKRLWMSFLC